MLSIININSYRGENQYLSSSLGTRRDGAHRTLSLRAAMAAQAGGGAETVVGSDEREREKVGETADRAV